MRLSINGDIIPKTKFAYPYRILLSGASGSGKTYLAGKILERTDLFERRAKRVIYFYPCFIKNRPVNWENTLKIPVSYRIGIPTQEDIDEMEPDTTIVIDDNYDGAVASTAVDHLFRVSSGKQMINVMIMTQNNFTSGKFTRDIRNQCNITILLRNYVDTRINKRVCQQLGLTKALEAAEGDTQFDEYPYFLIDQSPRAFASSYRLYTNIFSDFPVAYSVDGMKGYIVNESDFQRFFEIQEKSRKFEAIVKDEDEIKKDCAEIQKTRKRTYKEEIDSFTDDSSSSTGSEIETKRKQRQRTKKKGSRKSKKEQRKRKSKKSRRVSSSSSSSSISTSSETESDDEQIKRSVRKRRKSPIVYGENSGFSSSE
jgi:hypothetical protein